MCQRDVTCHLLELVSSEMGCKAIPYRTRNRNFSSGCWVFMETERKCRGPEHQARVTNEWWVPRVPALTAGCCSVLKLGALPRVTQNISYSNANPKWDLGRRQQHAAPHVFACIRKRSLFSAFHTSTSKMYRHLSIGQRFFHLFRNANASGLRHHSVTFPPLCSSFHFILT